MKVYIIQEDNYDRCPIKGVCSTIEQAERAVNDLIEEHNKTEKYVTFYVIYECAIDTRELKEVAYFSTDEGRLERP